MSIRRRMFAGGIALGVGQVLGQGCSLVRNAIVAHMISPDDFGIAASFWITIALLEIIGNMNIELLLTQAPDGDDPPFAQTAHSVYLVRGIVSAAVIFALAWPVSRLFGVPDACWAFRWLAVYPLIRGLANLDIVRVQRHLRFGPLVAAEGISQLIALLLAWPVAKMWPGYAAPLWLYLIQIAVYVACTHLFAERHYHCAWATSYARRIFSFGWPLLLSGVLMFLIGQGDQFVIGSSNRLFARATYSLTDLGVYAAALTLTMVPTVFLARIFGSLFFPLLSHTQNPEQFDRRYHLYSQANAWVSVSVVIVWMVVGHRLVATVYGRNYAAAPWVLEFLAMSQAFRLMRMPSSSAALAKADPHNSLITNATRAAWIGGALLVSAMGLPVVWIAACGLAGEAIAWVVALIYLTLRHGIIMGPVLLPSASILLWVLLAAGTMRLIPPGGWLRDWAIVALFLLLAAGFSLVVSPGLRAELHYYLARFGAGRPAPAEAAL